MCECKRCKSLQVAELCMTKIGKADKMRYKQRYKCQVCNYNFTVGDDRRIYGSDELKMLCLLMYTRGKGPLTVLANLFGHSPHIIRRWIREADPYDTSVPATIGDIAELGFDEIRQFIQSKKQAR